MDLPESSNFERQTPLSLLGSSSMVSKSQIWHTLVMPEFLTSHGIGFRRGRLTPFPFSQSCHETQLPTSTPSAEKSARGGCIISAGVGGRMCSRFPIRNTKASIKIPYRMQFLAQACKKCHHCRP